MGASSEQQFYWDRRTEYARQLAAAEEEARAAQAKMVLLRERIGALNILLDELNVDDAELELKHKNSEGVNEIRLSTVRRQNSSTG